MKYLVCIELTISFRKTVKSYLGFITESVDTPDYFPQPHQDKIIPVLCAKRIAKRFDTYDEAADATCYVQDLWPQIKYQHPSIRIVEE